MAKRDILKEAIADAKAVKETAIANAKAALEEAFTPQLKSMLSAKLEEMELDEEKEEKDMAEEAMRGPSYEEDDSDSMREEKKDMEEEINLDEILAEIELDEEKEDIDEDARTDAEEEGYEDGMEDEKEDMEDEEIDLEDMTDEDLKDFIEDVIADMVKSGELEAGESFEEEDEVDVDVEDEVDVEVTEGKKKKDDDKEDVKESTEIDEVTGNPISATVKKGAKNPYDEDFKKAVKDDIAKLMKKIGLKEEDDINEDDIDEVNTSGGVSMSYKKGNPYDEDFKKAVKDDIAKLMKKIGLKEDELTEAYTTIESLKSDLNEVNLLNAKLLYTNKIFKAKNLTESQKVKVLGAFDKAGTVKESKLVFETLNEGLKTKKSPITESLGAASRVSGNVNTKKPIIKTDPMVERFQKLAGLK